MAGVTYILNNDSTFRTLVGQNSRLTKYKVYPVIAPQVEVFPYSVVRMTSRVRECKGGGFAASFTVSSYAPNYEDVSDIDDAVVDALDGVSGTYNSVVFGRINFTDSRDDYVDTYGGLYVRVSTFDCSYA